jgi:hypothetical protein
VLGVIASALGYGKPVRRWRKMGFNDELRAFRIRGVRPLPYQVDGDHLGDDDDFVFRHEPDVLRLVMPGP